MKKLKKSTAPSVYNINLMWSRTNCCNVFECVACHNLCMFPGSSHAPSLILIETPSLVIFLYLLLTAVFNACRLGNNLYVLSNYRRIRVIVATSHMTKSLSSKVGIFKFMLKTTHTYHSSQFHCRYICRCWEVKSDKCHHIYTFL